MYTVWESLGLCSQLCQFVSMYYYSEELDIGVLLFCLVSKPHKTCLPPTICYVRQTVWASCKSHQVNWHCRLCYNVGGKVCIDLAVYALVRIFFAEPASLHAAAVAAIAWTLEACAREWHLLCGFEMSTKHVVLGLYAAVETIRLPTVVV